MTNLIKGTFLPKMTIAFMMFSCLSPAHLVQRSWSLQSTLMTRMGCLKNGCRRFQSITSKCCFSPPCSVWLFSLRRLFFFTFVCRLQGTRAAATFRSAGDVWVRIRVSMESASWDGETAERAGGQEHPRGQREAGGWAGVGQTWTSAHVNETW